MKAIIYVEGKSSSPFDNACGIECIKSDDLLSLPAAVYEEIELIDVLEFDKNPDILSVAIQKLRHNGVIRIRGTDAIEIMRESERGRIDMQVASEHLLNGRMRLASAHELREKLSAMQMNVSTVSIGGFRYLVEATRP
mgnify:CR=1 FL=1|jgi:hypothetical protein